MKSFERYCPGKERRSLLRQQASFSRAKFGQASSIWLQRADPVFAPRTFALWALSPGRECLSMLKSSIGAIKPLQSSSTLYFVSSALASLSRASLH